MQFHFQRQMASPLKCQQPPPTLEARPLQIHHSYKYEEACKACLLVDKITPDHNDKIGDNDDNIQGVFFTGTPLKSMENLV